jgi:hypothetical protein
MKRNRHRENIAQSLNVRLRQTQAFRFKTLEGLVRYQRTSNFNLGDRIAAGARIATDDRLDQSTLDRGNLRAIRP